MGAIALVLGLFLTLFRISKCEYPFGDFHNIDGELGSSGHAALATNPYQVAILARLPSNYEVLDGLRFICGGSLIAPQWILTSAQCVESPNLRVLLGVSNIRAFEPYHVLFDISPDNVTVHPQYQKGIFDKDIALIKMPVAVEFDKNIQPISLAAKSDETYDNDTAFLSGWGRSNSFIPVSDFLRQSRVKVMSNEQCQIQYRFPFLRISNDHLCTWDGFWFSETTSCPRDPGSPLIYFNSRLGRSEQIGIASKIPFDCTGRPTVFTKVSYFRNWINNVMEDRDVAAEEITEEPTTTETIVPNDVWNDVDDISVEIVTETTVEPTTTETTVPYSVTNDIDDISVEIVTETIPGPITTETVVPNRVTIDVDNITVEIVTAEPTTTQTTVPTTETTPEPTTTEPTVPTTETTPEPTTTEPTMPTTDTTEEPTEINTMMLADIGWNDADESGEASTEEPEETNNLLINLDHFAIQFIPEDSEDTTTDETMIDYDGYVDEYGGVYTWES